LEQKPSQELNLGSDRQLFIDEYVIDEIQGLTRTLNQPQKYAGNPIMAPLYPWEGSLWLYGDVVRDSDGGWRMWYTGPGAGGLPSMGDPNLESSVEKGYGAQVGGFDLANLHYIMGYATSRDGIFWERPTRRIKIPINSIINSIINLGLVVAVGVAWWSELVWFFGLTWYSNKARGMRKKAEAGAADKSSPEVDAQRETPGRCNQTGFLWHARPLSSRKTSQSGNQISYHFIIFLLLAGISQPTIDIGKSKDH